VKKVVAAALAIVVLCLFSLVNTANNFADECEKVGGKSVYNGNHYTCIRK
jgi:hypothetical protein